MTDESRVPPTQEEAMRGLCEGLGYVFRDATWLEAALTHRSFANERAAGGPATVPPKDNQRLEYLGDAVLSLVIAELIWTRAPTAREGEMSRIRAGIVNEAALAEAASAVGVGDALSVGRGEERGGGRERPSMLADALEAIFGAVHADGGLAAARGAILRVLGARVDAVLTGGTRDAKSVLQEEIQARSKVTPRYEIVHSQGPDHERVYEVEVRAGDIVTARGHGRSKKEATQAAAHAALEQLGVPTMSLTDSGANAPGDGVDLEEEVRMRPMFLPTLGVRRLVHAHDLALPAYASDGAAGLDLIAAVDVELTVAPGARAAVPTGLELEIPEGFEGQVRARSGRAIREGLAVVNAPGTIDSDYRGEVKVLVVNLGDAPIVIRRGERIAQLVISPYVRVAIEERDALETTARGHGGFGSTGR